MFELHSLHNEKQHYGITINGFTEEKNIADFGLHSYVWNFKIIYSILTVNRAQKEQPYSSPALIFTRQSVFLNV